MTIRTPKLLPEMYVEGEGAEVSLVTWEGRTCGMGRSNFACCLIIVFEPWDSSNAHMGMAYDMACPKDSV